MPRKAFLLGRNTGSLNHCIQYEDGHLVCCDIQLMEESLREHDFEITIPEPGVRKGTITDLLDDVVDDCKLEDTFLFYFSGHSHVDNGLRLVLENPFIKDKNLLPVRGVVDSLQRCKAAEKLLILDCCDAGQASEYLRPEPGNHFRVLTATDRLNKAKEVSGLSASVFTSHLHRALTDRRLRTMDEPGVLDKNGDLEVWKVFKWLERSISKYGEREGRDIPKPDLYGSAKKVFFARRLEPYHFESFSKEDIDEIRGLLRQASFSPAMLGDTFEDVVSKSDLRDGKFGIMPPNGRMAGLDEMLAYLVDVGVRRTAKIPIPLLEFVARLSDEASNADGLRRWIEDVSTPLVSESFTREHIEALGNTRKVPAVAVSEPRFLMVLLKPANEKNARSPCTAEAWLVDETGNGGNIAIEDEPFPIEKIPAFLQKAVHHHRVVEWLNSATQSLTIEFFLPAALLDSDLDKWTPPRGDERSNQIPRPFGATYALTIRSEERARPQTVRKWTEDWFVNWNRCNPCRSSPLLEGSTCVTWLEAPEESYFDLLDEDEACVLILNFVPQPGDLTLMLEQGISMVLWAGKPMNPATKDSIQTQLKRQPLEEFPQGLHKVRRKIWFGSGKMHSGHLSLLWDDPRRMPKRWGKKDRSGQRQKAVNPFTVKA